MTTTRTLKVSTPTDREIVMTRVFIAPRRLVRESMTRPELLRRWLFGPPGWSMTICDNDLLGGSAFRWVWRGPDGQADADRCDNYPPVLTGPGRPGDAVAKPAGTSKNKGRR